MKEYNWTEVARDNIRGPYSTDRNPENIRATYLPPIGKWVASINAARTNPVTNMGERFALGQVWGDTEREAVERAEAICRAMNAAEGIPRG